MALDAIWGFLYKCLHSTLGHPNSKKSRLGILSRRLNNKFSDEGSGTFQSGILHGKTMKAIIAKKVGMTTIFQENGIAVPVTLLTAGPCQITYVRQLKDGRHNIQLGFIGAKEKHLTKPRIGHLKGLDLFRELKEFRLPAGEKTPERGESVDVSVFEKGDVVRVAGTSKGKGFQGVVKRHHFKGGPRSHGHKHNLRAPGSIGATWPQRVMKGMRMAGRMGGERVTVENLEVVDVVKEKNLLVVKGAVPGARGQVLEVTVKQ